MTGSEFVKYTDTMFAVKVEGIVVADARQDVTVTIYDGDTVVTSATDSIESYTARKANENPLYLAILRFADAAYNSFH